MDWAILVKGVPPVEQLRFDPEQRTMIRTGSELILNPFDRRAIQLGLNLRKPGESVTVVSMGPASVEAALREALAVGVDRVILVSDPALAGSDTLVTARVLSRALERVGHAVVLVGRWAVDSETGQVGPEVAGLLGVPIATGAREVIRESSGTLVVTSVSGEGWLRVRWPTPVVVSVGEDAVRVRRPTPEEVELARARPLERWGLADVGLLPDQVGLAGSPTVVTALRDDQPTRSPTVLTEGSATERARAAADLVSGLVNRGNETTPGSPPPVHHPLADDREVFVLATDHLGRLATETLSLLGEVRRALPWLWPSAVWAGPTPTRSELQALSSCGTVRAYVAELDAAAVSSYSAAFALHRLLDRRPRVRAGMILADEFGRAVAGQLAARAELGLVGDAVAIRGSEVDGVLSWEKPSFGGGVLASIECRTKPDLATVRPGSFAPPYVETEASEVDVETLVGPFPAPSTERIAEGTEVDAAYGDLRRARVVVVAGTGIGGPEGISELLSLVRPIHAAVGATRRVADAKWVPRQRQVGLTGASVAPDLAVLVGVSGATNHLVGLRRARAIVALNSDPQAAVFRYADVGLLGPWRETLPAFVDAFRHHPELFSESA